MSTIERVQAQIQKAEARVASVFLHYDRVEEENTAKVLDTFAALQLEPRHFAATTGYGYDDCGRDLLANAYARIFGAEAALVRPQIASGTHVLSACLFALLRPGQKLLLASGVPYDTMQGVIGMREEAGSLQEWGIGHVLVPLLCDGSIDLAGVEAALQSDAHIGAVLMQRSRGYDWRASLSVEKLGEAIRLIHSCRPDIPVMVDNCYGEFVETHEPTVHGANLIAGSLIKNPGGGLAPTGGYVAGDQRWVDRVAVQLTAPGIGAEVGSWAAGYAPFFQGLFLAPHVVAQALKCATLFAAVGEALGLPVHPSSQDARTDIIQAVRWGSAERLIAFCEGIQAAAPVDSHVKPEPWAMPGYADPVIMAAGAFVGGASIELSADAPLREPYIAYMQGGLTYVHGRIALTRTLTWMCERGLIEL